jgi:glutathionylspermidine synthase
MATIDPAASSSAPPSGPVAPVADDYAAFAERIVAGGVLRDPWIDGRPRFRAEPVVVEAPRYAALCRAAEDVAAACHAMVSILLDEPRLLEDVLGLTPFQRTMWTAAAPSWHGVARADVFFTDDGVAVAELNCDTPTGEAEAVVLGRLAGSVAGTVDPNRALESRFLAMLEYVAKRERVPEAGPARTVGLVYPTELTEDLSLVRLYSQWLEGRGYAVVLGSPYNLGYDGTRTCLFDTPIDVLVRHYKTDWWGERESAWLEDPIDDDAPLEAPLRAVLSGMAAGTLAVVNPFGAVVPQNKRSYALMWEQIHRFPPDAQAAIERYVPVTRRLEVLHREQLLAQRADWVIKSDYGAEGEEVLVGREVNDAAWRAALARARPGRWIAQRYFAAETDARGESVNHGVFLVAGRAAGLYARVQAGATDVRARSAPVLVKEGGASAQ